MSNPQLPVVNVATRPLISTYTILVLSGILFGFCVSDNLGEEMKRTFVFAGATGLMAYLALGTVKRVQHHSQQRVAVMQAEERLDRHAHADARPVDRTNAPA